MKLTTYDILIRDIFRKKFKTFGGFREKEKQQIKTMLTVDTRNEHSERMKWWKDREARKGKS